MRLEVEVRSRFGSRWSALLGLLRWKEGWKWGVWVECGAEQKANGGHTERQVENQDRREGCAGRTGW